MVKVSCDMVSCTVQCLLCIQNQRCDEVSSHNMCKLCWKHLRFIIPLILNLLLVIFAVRTSYCCQVLGFCSYPVFYQEKKLSLISLGTRDFWVKYYCRIPSLCATSVCKWGQSCSRGWKVFLWLLLTIIQVHLWRKCPQSFPALHDGTSLMFSGRKKPTWTALPW